MSNFAFLRTAMPSVYGDCARAESYLSSDPRSVCFYSRRAIELLVERLYDVLDLPQPYKKDLAARTDAPGFKKITGLGITQKLTLIRMMGNNAVHKSQPISPHTALQVVQQLFDVMVWATFHHSAAPQLSPTGSQFDPALAAKAAPLSRDEIGALFQKFKVQDEAHAQQLAAKNDLLLAHEAEIAKLRAQIAAAQAANQKVDDHDYSEAETRDLFIDLMLNEAGWPLVDKQNREYPVTGMPNGPGKGFVDYVLWGADGLPLAVVEAKRTTKSALHGQQQAKLYADCLEQQFGRRPIVFYTNGYQHWLWDDKGGYPPREIQGFYTRDELDLLIQRRTTRLPLSTGIVDAAVAGRPYQVRAIKAVGDAFDRKQRQALLVMATGSGKTRTVIALVEQLMKANWCKRVLFLADRTALVNQAANAFKTHLPSVTTVNLVTEKAVDGRVYVSTYPTMLNLINQLDGTRKFGPGYFDLIVIDEAHRSVYAKYGAIFDWFDSLLVGLTATPKDEVDHNTYRLFHLEDGVPTDAYSLEEAVSEGYLVPPKGVAVGTKFLRQGIKYDDLSDEEKDEWDAIDWDDDGAIPSEVGAEEIMRFLFNEDTVDKVLGSLMADGYKVAGGDRIGKTIIFAKSQAHAEFIQKRFDLQWPEYAGHLARIITHGTPYAQSLIDDFSVPGKDPQIAISVDMLDTGIDVPDVVNLVFFKMVRSKSKFWQMIGRGTRLRPDLFGPGADKKDFLVFDFCGNLEFFSQDLPGSQGSLQKSLTQRIFESRLGLVTALDGAHVFDDLRADTASTLRDFVAGMTLDNVLVRAHRKSVEQFAAADSWASLSNEEAAEALELAGLPSSVKDADEAAKRFDLLILRRQLAQLEGDAVAAEKIRETVQALAVDLLGRTAIPAIAEQSVLLESVAGDEWWIDITLPMLEHARLKLRGLIRFVERTKRNPIYTDFADELGEATEIVLPGITPGTNFERFRAKARAYLLEHENHLTLQRLRRNKQLTAEDLTALGELLRDSDSSYRVDMAWVSESTGGLGLFVRSLVGLDREAVAEAFAGYLDGTRFSIDQIRFVNLIVEELTANGVMDPGRLFESPFTDQAPTGPTSLFPESAVVEMAKILAEVKATAVPTEVA
ncbi:DEAD/DEAH box helicase family protein [Nakamurella sp. A5-74]|uniref:DEAD/DEAH box helicase family protein n=1 Tax=Nakamurella sp. A5-74 TaxID=3158264 RepID=A0AAU8DR02_9ACTN